MEMKFGKILRKLAEFSSRLGTGDNSADLIWMLMAGQNGVYF
jgi:hypothetical protein